MPGVLPGKTAGRPGWPGGPGLVSSTSRMASGQSSSRCGRPGQQGYKSPHGSQLRALQLLISPHRPRKSSQSPSCRPSLAGWAPYHTPQQSKAPSVPQGALRRGPGTSGHINVNKSHSPRFQLVCEHTHTYTHMDKSQPMTAQKAVPTGTGSRTGALIS